MLYRNDLQSRNVTIELPEGALILQTNCPTWLVETLETDRGLRAFARQPDREHRRLLDIARRPENSLALAYTSSGVVVGQITMAPVDGWWPQMSHAYEIAFEVSPIWRKQGVAHRLLALVLEEKHIEDLIILGLGLSSHWDTERVGLSPAHYREMLIRFLAHHGFTDYLTSEPNIRMEPYNVLLARIGTRVPLETTLQFYHDLIS
jgi:GNAT superfamily N-acetyltransferase